VPVVKKAKHAGKELRCGLEICEEWTQHTPALQQQEQGLKARKQRVRDAPGHPHEQRLASELLPGHHRHLQIYTHIQYDLSLMIFSIKTREEFYNKSRVSGLYTCLLSKTMRVQCTIWSER